MDTATLNYFRSYLLDLRSVNAGIVVMAQLERIVEIDPALTYYRQYLGRT